jgi:hypothetical protein
VCSRSGVGSKTQEARRKGRTQARTRTQTSALSRPGCPRPGPPWCSSLAPPWCAPRPQPRASCAACLSGESVWSIRNGGANGGSSSSITTSACSSSTRPPPLGGFDARTPVRPCPSSPNRPLAHSPPRPLTDVLPEIRAVPPHVVKVDGIAHQTGHGRCGGEECDLRCGSGGHDVVRRGGVEVSREVTVLAGWSGEPLRG